MPMKYPPHPGRIIRSDMEALGTGVTETAKKLGVSVEQLQSVLNGEASVTPELAVELSKLFGGDASILCQLQARYDEAQERNRDDVPEELEPLPSCSQTATVPLEHGRLVYTTYDDEVIAFRTEFSDNPGQSGSPSHHRLELRFVGEGPGAVHIRLIYQPSPSATPLLAADVLFKAYLEWNATSDEYIGRIDGAEWNREYRKLKAGIETMNALHAGALKQPLPPAPGIEESVDSSPENYAGILREAEELLHKGTTSVSAADLAAV